MEWACAAAALSVQRAGLYGDQIDVQRHALTYSRQPLEPPSPASLQDTDGDDDDERADPQDRLEALWARPAASFGCSSEEYYRIMQEGCADPSVYY